MSIPTPHAIFVRRWQSGAERDPLGNPITGHGTPEPVAVHAIAPGASSESVAAGRNTDAVDWTIYAPAGVTVGARDLVLLEAGGDEYQVEGDSLDWTNGPWANPVAGVVIELKRQGG